MHMCFHLALIKKVQEIETRYQAVFENRKAFVPMYHGNGFLRISWPVIANHEPSHIRFFQWGLIPNWVREPEKAEKIQLHTLNARIETVFEKPAFRDAVRNRCLVIVTGFFEWMTLGKKKYPVFFREKDEAIFSLAGIWERWVHPFNSESIWTFSVLTMPAKGEIGNFQWIPPRMPVVLSESQEKEWLSGSISPHELGSTELHVSLVGYPVNKTLFQSPDFFTKPEVQSPEFNAEWESWIS